MFRHLKIRSKLLLVLAIPLLALALVITLGLITLRTVQVNGPRYRELAIAKDLTSDVNPPSQYVVEAFADTLQITGAQLTVDIPPLLQQIDQLNAQFESRHQYWTTVLPKGPLATALLVTSYQPAHDFFSLYSSSFKPAALAGNQPEMRRLATGPLARLFRVHRAAIDNVVVLANNEQASLEKQTATFIDNRTMLLLIAVIGLAGLSVLVGLMVVRAISRPLRQLTANANEVASTALPEAVAAAQEGQPAAPLRAPVGLDSRDEIADLARAMTAMQSTALDLAVDQARMRRNVAEMFVNLGRRNQSLLSRQLAFISDLEQNERSPDALDDLFRLDHLATRMRRNAESLLVLAGAEPARTWSKPVPAEDVVRSALSEIEAYDRVDLITLDAATVRGHAAADLAHLLAELLENATSFSPPTTRVTVVGKRKPEGYSIAIVDQGIGMAPLDLVEANRRIVEVARFEEAPSKVLGLFVVGRLAARHGINVTLTDSPTEGVTAKVTVPLELLETPPPAPDRASGTSAPLTLAEAIPSAPVLDRALDDMARGVVPPPPVRASAPPLEQAPPPPTVGPMGFGGLSHRIRGAQLPDTGPAKTADDELPPPDPSAVRAQLLRLTEGQARAHDLAGRIPPAPPAPPAPETEEDDLIGGLRRRVRGAQLPDTGPGADEDEAPARDPAQVRSVLSNFARGVALGRRVTGPSDPPGGDA